MGMSAEEIAEEFEEFGEEVLDEELSRCKFALSLRQEIFRA